ncbi:MAG TPA: alpha/beta hydrolase [Pseudonocardia sp.]|jgi:acetyl esterase|uniref:alpha/beta hydrolase n=1 Tax=Pseudonocardia sp. TaxID=60912 RepID=UPI002D0B70F7|nr:alpha/beta hydrolase [Pseudonocardia sp.]HTF49392.1 alpha/beta hydrolase [Pseudonocardia sp.]
MAVDPGIAPFLARVNRRPPPSEPVSLAQARRGIYRLAEIVAPQPAIAMYSVEDTTIPGPVTDIPLRTYRPTADPAPTAVYFHGGGWMTGGIASHDFLVRKLARESGLVFVSVDYRLAPEHPFPAGLDDCLAATAWVAEHIHDYGGLAGQLSVAGDSSGGNLAAVVARRFRDQGRHLGAQLLLYPVIDSAGDYPSRHENGYSYLLTRDDIVTSAQNYLGDRVELLGSADVAPIRATDLHGLAPAVIGVAHHDPLRDEGLAYANKLAATGVDVFAKDYPGMIHTFASLYAISPGADHALRELLTEFARRARA